MGTRPAVALFILAFVVISGSARAQQRVPTVDRLVDDLLGMLAGGLQRESAAGTTLAWRLDSDVSGPRLVRALDGLLASRLGQIFVAERLVRAAAPPAPAPVAADVMLRVEVFSQGNRLHAVAEIRTVRVNFWTRIRRPPVGIRTHAYASVRLDAELRALLGLAPRRLQLRLRPVAAPRLGVRPLAVGVGDLDGDGQQELVLLDSSKVVVAQLQAGTLVAVGAPFELAGLEAARVRSRERFGAVLVEDIDLDGRAEVVVWTNTLRFAHVLREVSGRLVVRAADRAFTVCGEQRGRGEPLVLCGPAVAAIPGMTPREPPALVLAQESPGRNHMGARVRRWRAGAEGGATALEGLYWALAAHSLKLRGPGQFLDLSGVVDREGVIRVQGGGRRWRVEGGGTALALLDFQDDGEAELVRSGAGFPGEPDELAVVALLPRGGTRTLFRHPLPEVVGVAVGDPDNDGLPEVVVVESDRLYLLEER